MNIISQKECLVELNLAFNGIFRIRGKNAYGDGTKNSFNVTIEDTATHFNIKKENYETLESTLVNALKSKGFKVEYLNLLTWTHGYLSYVITKSKEVVL